ncbi:hypothetical protein KCU81_g9093, partial [Aureobasidium melanogenum]|uniref:Uncharacterized protein n=1 Tax=Aureobasidium melanogenum (strain CBS 110374) TaxID=1043003 RepID=A0A074W6T5_AURM1
MSTGTISLYLFVAGFSALERRQMDASDLTRRGGSSPAVCDAGKELTSTWEPGGHVWGSPKRWTENARQAWLMSHKGLDWVAPVESQGGIFFFIGSVGPLDWRLKKNVQFRSLQLLLSCNKVLETTNIFVSFWYEGLNALFDITFVTAVRIRLGYGSPNQMHATEFHEATYLTPMPNGARIQHRTCDIFLWPFCSFALSARDRFDRDDASKNFSGQPPSRAIPNLCAYED